MLDVQSVHSRDKEECTDTFSELPNELVIEVAKFLPDSDLAQFSVVSRRLHYISVMVYLHRHGIHLPSPPGELKLSGPVLAPVLGFWRCSLAFQCPDSLTITFSDDPDEYTRFGRFFSSLQRDSALKTVELRLSSAPLAGFAELLETLENTGVMKLTIWHFSSAICRPLPVLRHASSLPHLLLPTLKVFEPQAIALFESPLYQWTVTTINASCITELTLMTPGIGTPSWTRILERLEVSTLHVLRIEGELTQLALDHFLRRHDDLRELHIGYNSHCGSAARRRSPSPLLPRLRILSGPLTYLLRLLSDDRHPLAALEKLEVLPDLGHDNPTEYVCNLSKALEHVVACGMLWCLSCTVPSQLAAENDDTPFGDYYLHAPDAILDQVKSVVLEQASRPTHKEAFSATLLVSSSTNYNDLSC